MQPAVAALQVQAGGDDVSWCRFDDGFWCHPKVIALSDAAVGVFVKLCCYSSQQLTDGALTGPVVAMLSMRSPEALDELVTAGLLERGDGGYQIHDYLDYNPSAREVKKARSVLSASRSKSGRSGARAKWSQNDSSANSLKKDDGKTIANGMAKPWQNDGPVPVPVPNKKEEEACASALAPSPKIEPRTSPEPVLTNPAGGPPKPTASADVAKAFDHWRFVLRHPNAKLDNKRRAKIEQAIKSHGIDDVIRAIDGCASSAWHMGANEDRKRFDDIELILRDAKHIEQFLAIISPPPPITGPPRVYGQAVAHLRDAKRATPEEIAELKRKARERMKPQNTEATEPANVD